MKKVTLSGSLQTQTRPEQEGTAENTKLSITSSFFELETPDFAQKFVYKKYKSTKYS